MAIIKCPECGGNVSDVARKCPHCGTNINSSIPEVTGHRIARNQARNADSDYEETFYEKHRALIIISVVILLGITGYFMFQGQPTEHATEAVDTARVDTLDIAVTEEYVSALPSFSEIKDFICNCEYYDENHKNSLNMPLLYEYDETLELDSIDGPPEHDWFYGIDAKVYRNQSNGKYTIDSISEHAMVIAVYQSSDDVPFVYFSNQNDYDVFRQQSEDYGYDPDRLHFYGLGDHEYFTPLDHSGNKWYKVEFVLQ